MSKFFAAVGVGALLCSAVWSSEFSEAQAKVREKYPEEFAAIQKLAATDIAEAQKKLVELAKKGNIRVPSRRSSRRSFQEGPGMRSGMNMRGGRGGMGMMRMGQFNLLRRFDQLVGRHFMSLLSRKIDLSVKFLMTHFVWFPAAAPAGILPTDSSKHNLLPIILS